MKNLHEVIELSNAAAKLLSAANERASHQADSLAAAMMDKARSLLADGTAQASHLEGDIRNGNVTIGGIEIGYCDDGSVWLMADGNGGSFRKDEFEAAVRQFINERI